MSAMPDHFRSDERPTVEHLRVPPQSLEAEQSVLGAVMLAPKALWRVRDLLAEGDFYRRDHRLIYRAILELEKAGKPFDSVTLGDWFEAHGLAEQIGGSGYLIELASQTPSAANVKAYAEIVRDKSVLRQLIEAGTEIVNNGFTPDGRSAFDVLADAQSRLVHVLRNEPCELEAAGPILTRMLERGQAFMDAGGQFDGLTTGFPELDKILCGLKGGQLIVFAGRPKMGKTTLARCVAEHVALVLGKVVAFHSLEMSPEEQMQAACCSVGQVSADSVRRWDLTPEEWRAFTLASSTLAKAPLLFSRPRNTRAEQLVAQTKRAHAEKPLSLVVIDYLQLIQMLGDNRSQAIGDVTRALKMMAVELNVPVILLSQLNRKLEERTDKRPLPSDLRDGGTIEQDADVVLFVYRDEVYHKHSDHRGTAELIVSLQRGGPTGTARVLSRLDISRFDPLPIDWMPPVQAPANDGSTAPRRTTRGKYKTRGGDYRTKDDQ
jgi:replicative DNA helicase